MRKEVQEKIENSISPQVDLRELKINDEEVSEIIKKINNFMPNVERIFLSGNNISDLGANILGERLTLLSQLSFIDLQFNNIGKEGALKIFGLKVNRPKNLPLQIAFHGNKISNVVEMQEIEAAALKKSNTSVNQKIRG